MECSRFEELLSDYIEGTLDDNTGRQMAAHIELCPQCRCLHEDLVSILSGSSQLEEEVPFFLRNRLYYIPEAYSVEEDEHPALYMKWAAAMIATMILFFNLFYFTNIFPQANRTLHGLVSGIERIAVETEALFFRFQKDQEVRTMPISFIGNESRPPAGSLEERTNNG